MATVDKNFKVKHGLVVEGTTATVNGNDILTTASTISTTNVTEGTNLYFTDTRAKTSAADLLTSAELTNITITGDENGLVITAENGGIQDLTGFDTDDLSEGLTHLYFTSTRAQNEIESRLYDNFPVGPGTGISITSYIGPTGPAEVSINRSVVDTWYDEAGAAGAVASDLTDHMNDTSAHGVTGDVVGTSDTQTLTNKTINGVNLTGNTDFLDVSENTYLTIFKNDSKTQLLSYSDLRVYSSSDIILDAVGESYVGSATSGNEIATKGYVDGLASNYDEAGAAASALSDAQAYADSLVQGLNVKDSVRTASTTNIANLGDVPGTIGGVTLANGDRVLLKNQSNASQNGIYVYAFGLKGTLTRAEDQTAPEKGDYALVVEGTYAATGWLVSANDLMTGNTWTQFSAANEYTAGNGINIDGNSISVDTEIIASVEYVDTNFVNVSDLPGQLEDYIPLTQKDQAGGVATLDETGNVPAGQLGNVPAPYITSVGTNLSVTDGELDLAGNPSFDEVNIASVAKQIATINTEMTAGFSGIVARINLDTYRSGKFTVKVNTGTDTEISEILLTTDSANNIAITEYGIVGTNGSLSTISASVSSGQVLLQVTPTYVSDVTVFGTLLV